MRRALMAGLFVGILVPLLLVACGDESGPPSGGGPAAPPEDEPEAEPPAVEGLDLDWWRRKPAISLLLSGGQRGHVRPCGCAQPRRGGLVRAASVAGKLRKRMRLAEGALGAISLGWSMRGSHEPQEEAKADLLRAVQHALGYSATLLGGTDLVVPAMCQPRAEGGVELPHPPINVRLAQTNPACDATPFVDLNMRNLKVRAISVLEPSVAEDLQSGGFVDAVVSISRAFEALKPRPDTVWIVSALVLDDATLETIRASAQRLGPAVIVDVGGSGRGQARFDERPVRAGGEPLVVELDAFGKSVGVLDLDNPPEGDGWVATFRRIDLVPQWEKYDGPELRAAGGFLELYRAIVREDGYLGAFDRHADAGASYVGSGACARCHGAIYRDWRKSRHASALATLAVSEDTWDPECIRCHTVGWERSGTTWSAAASGFRDPERTPFLRGVGCENCHGPGSRHVEAPDDRSLFGPGGPNVARPGRESCVSCHDAENSVGFPARFERRYLPQVDHHLVPSDVRTVAPK
jgi:hypothetical protein